MYDISEGLNLLIKLLENITSVLNVCFEKGIRWFNLAKLADVNEPEVPTSDHLPEKVESLYKKNLVPEFVNERIPNYVQHKNSTKIHLQQSQTGLPMITPSTLIPNGLESQVSVQTKNEGIDFLISTNNAILKSKNRKTEIIFSCQRQSITDKKQYVSQLQELDELQQVARQIDKMIALESHRANNLSPSWIEEVA